MKNKREAKKIKPLRVGAVGSLALLCSKFAQSFHAQNRITGIASTKSLEKIKTCRRSRKNLSAVFDKVCVPFFRQSLARVFSEATKEIGEKLVSKFHDKVEQISTARFKNFRLAISGSCSFAPRKCACHQRFFARRALRKSEPSKLR